MLYLGIDFGTSGARAIVIDQNEQIQCEVNFFFADLKLNDLIQIWQRSLDYLIEKIPLSFRQQIERIAINGTSATVLLCNERGNPIDSPLLYHDERGIQVLENLKKIVPPNHLGCSPTSSLAKLLWWAETPIIKQANYFLHQADWLAFLLHGKLGISDYHNALKSGYDAENLCYPDWLKQLSVFPLLPRILPPGTPIKSVTSAIAKRFNFPQTCLVCTGTTDSIAAFLASGCQHPGEAVTSLGSTLVLKLLSQSRIEDTNYGIYSHRLGDLWLAGGASNTGGAVLSHFFSDQELEELSQQINADRESSLDYYPLLKKGDRFPINNPYLIPKLEPHPENPIAFLHGLLESMARIEALGYQRLKELGATPLKRVYTAGGGAKNLTWQTIRKRHLKVPVLISPQTAAAYGTALLAKGIGSGFLGLTKLTE